MYSPKLINEETDKPNLRDIVQNNWFGILKSSKAKDVKEKTKELYGLKEIRQLNVTHSSRLALTAKKDITGTTEELEWGEDKMAAIYPCYFLILMVAYVGYVGLFTGNTYFSNMGGWSWSIVSNHFQMLSGVVLGTVLATFL